MKKLILLVLCLVSLKSFSQDHAAQIDAFRKNYMNDFLEDKNAPLKKKDLSFLRFYDADSTYRVMASATLQFDDMPIIITSFDGREVKYLRYALLTFTLNGKPLALTLYKSMTLSANPMYKDYLFLPFTDETNTKTTYGGGRYIDLHESDINNGILVLDFNKAYNPYCAFSSGYSCPKPPNDNNLLTSIEAGEKIFAREAKH